MIGRTWIASLLSLLVLTGCSRREEAPEEEGVAKVVVASTGGDVGSNKAADAPPSPREPSAPAPAVTVSNRGKSVKVAMPDGGATLDLENETGKGSVSTSPSGTTIKGKNGKSITLPGIPR